MAGSVSAGSITYEVDIDTARLIQGRREVDAALNGMNGGMGRLEASVNRTERSIANMDRSMSNLSGVARGLMAALSVQQVANYADAWTTLNNKLANAVRPQEQLVDVTSRVFEITQQTRSSLDATATLYARLERGTREYNTSAEDLAKLTTIINQGFVVSGATAQEAENAIIQLSQGIASGALRGEEFNSVAEQGSRLMVALADSLGVGIGQLRAMAAEGKLTTDVVVNGLLSQGDAIGKEFANTVTTISQAMQVAGNNITKFFGENATVKSFVSAFNDSIVSVSENMDALAGVITIAAAVLGARFTGALAIATAEKIKSAAAARQLALADNQSASSAALQAAATLRSAEVAKVRALEEVRLAQMMKATAFSAASLTAAEEALSAARVAAATTVGQYNAALAANAVAQDAAAAAATRASLSGGILRRALSLVGGAQGAAMLAGAAIYYFYQRAQEARDEANKLADSVNELGAKFQSMSHVELAATLGKLSSNLPELSDAVSDAQKAFDKATASVQFHQREIEKYGTNTTRGRQAAEALGGAQDRLAIATGNLDEASRRYSQTLSAINIGRAMLSGEFRQGIDLLRRDGQEAGIAAGMMKQLGEMTNFAAKAKQNFNSSSLKVERPKNIQEYLDKQLEQIELQSEFNDKKRAQLKAEQELRALGGTDADINLARERAGVEFDAEQAIAKRRKEQQQAEQQSKRSATAAESDAQKVQKLKEASELAAESTEQLSRSKAILNAQNSLSKNASPELIKQAGEHAAKAWDTANAIKAQAAAEKLLPEARENTSYQEDVRDLDTALSAKKISQEQYNETIERLEAQHQSNLAKIRADQAVSPQMDAAGTVDPIQQLANEHTRKLELIKQFEANKTITEEQAIALRNAANTQYEKQRVEAGWEIYRNQSLANEAAAAAFDGFANSASNALTGIITGSMDASEALRSIGNTVLNEVINTFVQMGIQQAKSAIMGGAIQEGAIASVTAAQVGSLATTTAASTASAATTTAAWTPAALVASIGSFGGAAAIGLGALVAALAVGKGLSGKRKNGGPVSAGSMYQVGEGGMPEIYRASTGKQYMIPGDNGSVISNKEITGGGGVQFILNVTNTNGSRVEAGNASYQDGAMMVDLFIGDMETGGPMSSAIQSTFGLSRNANGDY
ncbi:tape measure protein [Atlantibacter sp. RC6]|uniref:tape measure protein n=1 Tax=Atlantibacter sp. RC6 TaxID=2587036 RepID=UPI001606B23C|nr:tape measure protein [Atlantibacter sp. RC6]MBB3320897.1 tape measure domain-containing protein [Atlantibacter sp. RC6]